MNWKELSAVERTLDFWGDLVQGKLVSAHMGDSVALSHAGLGER